MENLRRKSFYLYDHPVRLLADHIYATFRRTGRRVTESEVIRAALDVYFSSLEHRDAPADGNHESPADR